MKPLIFAALIIGLLAGCKPITYKDAVVTKVVVREYDFDGPYPNDAVLALEGPDTYHEGQSYFYLNTEVVFDFLSMNVDKVGKDYTLTLYNQNGASLDEVGSVSFDMGDYRGQESFRLEGDNITMIVNVDWKKRF
ncbi:MAG: hypothetical protein RL226_1207 [Bacteroidota bacterium]|jgi:hypothetical protein